MENWEAAGRKTHLISEAEDCLLPFVLVQTTLKLLDDKKTTSQLKSKLDIPIGNVKMKSSTLLTLCFSTIQTLQWLETNSENISVSPKLCSFIFTVRKSGSWIILSSSPLDTHTILSSYYYLSNSQSWMYL